MPQPKQFIGESTGGFLSSALSFLRARLSSPAESLLELDDSLRREHLLCLWRELVFFLAPALFAFASDFALVGGLGGACDVASPGVTLIFCKLLSSSCALSLRRMAAPMKMELQEERERCEVV